MPGNPRWRFRGTIGLKKRFLWYFAQGGLKAVVWTDVVQTFAMFGALILVAVKGTMDLGGAHVVLNSAWQSGRLELPEWVMP